MTQNLERNRRVDELFCRALSVPEEQRAIFLKDCCEGDQALIDEVESLIQILSGTPPDKRQKYEVGLTFNERFQLQEKLGQGAFGEVWKAQDLKLERPIALKVWPSFRKRGLEAALREARACTKIQHENVVRILDAGEFDNNNGLFIAMEFLPARSLAERAQGLTPKQRLEILRQLASALSATHSKGVIHRDLKLENVLLTAKNQVKLTDFGIAQVGDQSHPGDRLYGSLPYMAPELFSAQVATEQTDIYAFGATAYALLSGRLPFVPPGQAVQTATLLAAIKTPQFHSLEALPASVPEAAKQICLKCLEFDATQRYQSARDLEADFTALIELRPTSFEQRNHLRRTSLWLRRHKLLTSLILLVLLLVPITTWGWRSFQEARSRRQVEWALTNLDLSIKRGESATELRHWVQVFRLESQQKVASYIRIARLCMRARLWPEAREFLSEARKLDPPGYTALLLLHEMELEEKDLEAHKMTPAMETLIELSKSRQEGHIAIYVAQAMKSLTLEKPEQALSRLKYAETHYPRFFMLHLLKGHAYLRLKQYSEALKSLNFAIEINAQSHVVWLLRAQTQLRLQQYQEALEDTQRALNIRSDVAAIWRCRARIRVSQEQRELALKDLAQAIKLDPKHPDGYYFRSEIYNHAGDWSKSLKDLKKVLQLHGQNAKVYLAACQCQRKLGQLDEALKSVNQALKLKPKLAMAWAVRARLHEDLKQWQRGLQDINKALKLDPSDADSLNRRGFIFVELGELERAKKDFLKAAKLKPRWGLPIQNLGRVAQMQGRPQDALKLLNQAISLEDNPLFRVNRASLRFALQDFEGAILDTTLAIEKAPKNYEAYHYRAQARLSSGKLEAALLDYDTAVALRPKFSEAHGYRATVLSHMRRLREAVMGFKKALSLNPKCLVSLINYSSMLIDIRRMNVALTLLDQALKIAPRDTTALFLRGNAYFQKSEFAKAEAEYSKALAIDPSYAMAYLNRATAFVRQKKYSLALRDFLDFQKNDPVAGQDPKINGYIKKLREVIARQKQTQGQQPKKSP